MTDLPNYAYVLPQVDDELFENQEFRESFGVLYIKNDLIEYFEDKVSALEHGLKEAEIINYRLKAELGRKDETIATFFKLNKYLLGLRKSSEEQDETS